MYNNKCFEFTERLSGVANGLQHEQLNANLPECQLNIKITVEKEGIK
jgi:hypothetical protein